MHFAARSPARIFAFLAMPAWHSRCSTRSFARLRSLPVSSSIRSSTLRFVFLRMNVSLPATNFVRTAATLKLARTTI